jgi:hypothetical protein
MLGRALDSKNLSVIGACVLRTETLLKPGRHSNPAHLCPSGKPLSGTSTAKVTLIGVVEGSLLNRSPYVVVC